MRLSVQSQQRCEVPRVNFCRYSRVVGALSLACSAATRSRARMLVPDSLPELSSSSFWLGSAAFTRRLDSSALQRFQRRCLITAVSRGDA